MAFWSRKAAFWSNPAIEPKRPYRFIVPIPIIMPKKGSSARGDWFSKSFVSDGAIANLNQWRPQESIVEFPVITCTKPGFKTEAYRTTNGAGGFARKRTNQPSVYNFSPVMLEIVDTISHDLEATITALLYGRGLLKDAESIMQNPDAGRLISFGNAIETIAGGQENGCSGMRVQTNLHIYEVNAKPRFISDNPGAFFSTGQLWSRARELKLNNSCITGAEFGMLDYRGEQLSTVRLTIDYDSFDYRFTSDSGLPGSDEETQQRRADAWARRQNYGLGGWMP